MEIKPGIYNDMPNETYHGHQASYSKTPLSSFSKFPYMMLWDRLHHKKKDTFDPGTAAHAAILEPEKWGESVAVIPKEVLSKSGSKAGNKWKEWEAAHKDKAIITQEQYDRVMRIVESIHENPYHSQAKKYLTGGKSEISVFWNEYFHGEGVDENTGYNFMHHDPTSGHLGAYHSLLMKCRPDHYPVNLVITDLKTTAVDVADDDALIRQAYKLKYHWSAALTCRGMTIATGKPHNEYIFVFVSLNPKVKTAPAARVLRATSDFIALGKKEIMGAMRTLAWCDLHNKWPWLPNKVGQMELPGYVHKKLYEETPVFETAD